MTMGTRPPINLKVSAKSRHVVARAADAQRCRLGCSQLIDAAGPASQALQLFVMKDHYLAVCREMHVAFDGKARIRRCVKGGKSVLPA